MNFRGGEGETTRNIHYYSVNRNNNKGGGFNFKLFSFVYIERKNNLILNLELVAVYPHLNLFFKSS